MTVTPYGDVTAGDVTLQRPGGEQRRVLINPIGRVLFTRQLRGLPWGRRRAFCGGVE